MIDSHCHLADPQFNADLPDVLSRAAAAGVSEMVVIADSLPEAERCVLLANTHAQLFCTVGVHPHHAKDWRPENVERLKALVDSCPKARAIGEIGLDYHYNFSDPDAQRAVFASQLTIAQETALPAVVHCREAVEDVWAIVRESSAKIVLHCCTEKWEDVEPFVASGHLLSFTGIATYANADDIRRTIERCPLESMMIETDSPYLAPVPHRGKRNEPAYVAEVLRLVAELKGIDVPRAEEVLTATTRAFFGLPG